jgi:hypothetical protein
MSESTPSPDYAPPIPDGRQSATALAVQRGTGRLLLNLGFAVLPEFTLATGRRADLAAVKSDGTIWIIEIKSSPEDLRVDQKWPEYRDYCDKLFFAIPTTMDESLIPQDAGLIVADAYGAEIMRETEIRLLAAARRKAITLAFARVAAHRLHGLWDP